MIEKAHVFERLRNQNIRITKQRKAIIDILDGQHLTLSEIHEELKKKGFGNLGTVYNNLDFLIEHGIVTQVFINDRKHYDLTLDDASHDPNNHIHMSCRINNKIVEIDDADLFDMIRNHEVFRDFDIQKLQIVVEGACPSYDPATCKVNSACHIAHQPDEDIEEELG